ncbi:MAG: hypothetical protein OER82_12705, partial [Nitrosopumilus sp.]|nr:hypothetical protein [Nitrosopumilus sp.]
MEENYCSYGFYINCNWCLGGSKIISLIPNAKGVYTIGYYILSGVLIPRRFNDFSRVILRELTKHKREFSRFSS